MPIMSLQTGAAIATTTEPIIIPDNLSVLAYKVEGALLGPGAHYVRLEDVRELSDVGLIVDSIDELVDAHDIIKLEQAIELKFHLSNMSVMDETGHKIGKVVDFTVDTMSFMVQQLTVKRPILKSFNDTELLIHRSQIIEINDNGIVVHSRAKTPEHTRLSGPGAHHNPFRKTNPAQNYTSR